MNQIDLTGRVAVVTGRNAGGFTGGNTGGITGGITTTWALGG